MDAGTFQLIITTVMGIMTIFVGIILYHKKARDNEQIRINEDFQKNVDKILDKVSELEKKQSEHDYKFVTGEEVRSIVSELTQPIASEITESKALINQMFNVVNSIKIQVEIQKAISQKDKKGREDD